MGRLNDLHIIALLSLRCHVHNVRIAERSKVPQAQPG